MESMKGFLEEKRRARKTETGCRVTLDSSKKLIANKFRSRSWRQTSLQVTVNELDNQCKVVIANDTLKKNQQIQEGIRTYLAVWVLLACVGDDYWWRDYCEHYCERDNKDTKKWGINARAEREDARLHKSLKKRKRRRESMDSFTLKLCRECWRELWREEE